MAVATIPERKFTDVNDAFLTALGYEMNEVIGKMPIDLELFVSPDEQAAVADRLQTDGHIDGFEALVRRKDGTVLHGIFSGELLGSVGRQSFLTVMVDITARKQAEQALVRERRRYQTLVAIAQDGIYLLDERGTLVEANEAFLSMRGLTSEAIGRLNVRDWDAAFPADQLEALLQHGRPLLFETKHRHADGRVLDVEVHVVGVELDGQRYKLAVSRDITVRKELQRQIEEHNRSLADRVSLAVAESRTKDQLLIAQSKQAAMGEMIGNIAHQWRQPLNALARTIGTQSVRWLATRDARGFTSDANAAR
jgi:PAS domain S-box-containing protein